MSLEKLYHLQKCYQDIKYNNRRLKKERNGELLKDLEKEIKNLNEHYLNIEKEIHNIKERYNYMSEKVDSLRKQMEKDEYVLYNEAGSDIKLIENIQKEIKENKQGIENMEDDILELMNKEENLKEKKISLKEKLESIKERFYNTRDKNNTIEKECRCNIDKAEKEIKKLKEEIPKKILQEFDDIREEKGTAVCKVEDGICLGCSMNIASETLDELKKNNKIVHCDNCGRILYYVR